MLTTTWQRKGPERANKIYVNTKHSSDGRNLEGFWLSYEPPTTPEASYALYLLEFTLNLSEGVDYYIVYGPDGSTQKVPDKEKTPKRW